PPTLDSPSRDEHACGEQEIASRCGQRSGGRLVVRVHGAASDAVPGQAGAAQRVRIQQVAPVDHHRLGHHLRDVLPIQRPVLRPLGQHHQPGRVLGHLVGILHHLHPLGQQRLIPTHDRIMGHQLRPRLDPQPRPRHRRRLPHIPGTGLERPPPHPQPPPGHRPPRRPPPPWPPPAAVATHWPAPPPATAKTHTPPTRPPATTPQRPWASTNHPTPGPAAKTPARSAGHTPCPRSPP